MVTLDDGVLKIFALKNGTSDGTMPSEVLDFKTAVKYGVSTLGVTRYYAAKQAGVEISCVVDVYADRQIRVNDIAVFEDGQQTRIGMIQPYKDDGVLFYKLTLERIDSCYEVSDTCGCSSQRY